MGHSTFADDLIFHFFAANTIRPTTVTYPNGRVVTYGYDSSNAMADALSRVAAVIDNDGGPTHLADYSYLGQQSFVETDYTQPDVKYTLVGTAGGDDPDTGDIYRGLDRFGRVRDSHWYNYGTSADADRIKYGYDRSGSRIWRENVVARSLGKYFDEKYLYDESHRLKDMSRGELNSLKSQISDLQFSQCWGLDETGNWSNFREDSTGAGSWTLNQSRTSNTVNEITDVTETVGASWVTPVYSRAGNMTTMPKPASPASSYTATYDAWNRLVKIADGANTVSEYQYDGAKRRVVQKSYVSGTLSETRHLYYTEPSKWQVVEERVGTSTNANRQFVWGLRYIDDIILRDRDTDGNGTLDERLYGMQDANWNVTALVNTSGAVQQRFAYTAYGLPIFTNSTFTAAGNTAAWEVLYAGYRFEAATSLMCVRHRVLNAALGCWVQRDPIGYADGKTLYMYAGARVVIATDPSGLLLGFAYGRYCGYSGAARCPPGSGPKPIDALDAACERHDCCQNRWWTCNPYHIAKCSCALCQEALDAWNGGWSQSHADDKKACACEKAAAMVGGFFCPLCPSKSFSTEDATRPSRCQKALRPGIDEVLIDTY